MLERFLRRLAVSPYKEHFVLKGGVLVAAFVGLDYRNTMDIDMTLLHYSLHEDKLAHALNEIISYDIGDDTAFHLLRMESIRQDDEYGGLRIYMQAQSGTIAVPFSIDVSTGDAITPQPIETDIPSFFDALSPVRIWSYNVETVLAEKLETILRRGVLSTGIVRRLPLHSYPNTRPCVPFLRTRAFFTMAYLFSNEIRTFDIRYIFIMNHIEDYPLRETA